MCMAVDVMFYAYHDVLYMHIAACICYIAFISYEFVVSVHCLILCNIIGFLLHTRGCMCSIAYWLYNVSISGACYICSNIHCMRNVGNGITGYVIFYVFCFLYPCYHSCNVMCLVMLRILCKYCNVAILCAIITRVKKY